MHMFIQSQQEIIKEEFEYLQDCDIKEFNKAIENIATNSPWHPCAYGFSNPSLLFKDGKYFVTWKRWDSCD